MLSENAASKSVSGLAHAKAVANLDVLYRIGMLDETHPDAKGEPTIAAIHRVVAPMLDAAGNVLAVKMTVQETTSPSNPNPLYSEPLYSVEAVDVAKPALLTPETGGERGTESDRPPLQASFSPDVTRMLQEFKRHAPLFPKDGGTISDRVMGYYVKNDVRMVTHSQLGDVDIKRSGIKASIAHGVGGDKIDAFAAVPDIIREGRRRPNALRRQKRRSLRDCGTVPNGSQGLPWVPS